MQKLISNFIHFVSENANSLYIPLTIFIFMDYVTGVCLAVKEKKVSSKIGFLGIMRKVLIYGVAVLGRVLDRFLLTANANVESMVILFYLSNEGISILENLTKLGVPFPAKFKQIFKNISNNRQK